MKSKVMTTVILAGLLFSLLSARVSMAAGAEGNVRMSRIERASTARTASKATTARSVTTLQSERTDSWLCAHVSPFFCSDLFPTLTTTPDPPKSPMSVRGRN